ncbi:MULTISPECIES: hypothetical protein [unclassified Actinomadura]|uniref:hypothetical protein n=1 Tax=unclassified Actinomadura TaxID=2626254 RepID=UPI0011EE23E9|nr:hypothetical protein [Actinomadura sp. K4S16]
MAPHSRIRANDLLGCTAGLLRFATPDEMDVLLGHLPLSLLEHALSSHGTPNRVVLEALLRRGRAGDLDLLVRHAVLVGDPPELLGRLLDLDDPEVNATLLTAESALGRIPRNLRRQLAHQTSRRDGVTPLPLPAEVREALLSTRGQDPLDHALLYAADPDLAGGALLYLGAGADPHGAVQACRTLLDAHREHEIRRLVEDGRLPAYRWGPDQSEPSVLAYAQAALASAEGERRLRELAGRARRPEFLRTVAEIADADGCEPWRGTPLVRTVVNRRAFCIPRVGWDAVLADEPRRRAAEGPFPLRAARFMAKRTDVPLELVRMLVADHPETAVYLPDPAPEVLADLVGLGARAGADVIVKVVGNGLVAGTLTPDGVAAAVPEETLRVVADALWLPGLRGTARLRAGLGLDGDVVLAPPFVDETGHGRARNLREPGVRRHWDPELAYGKAAGRLFRGSGDVTADAVLGAAEVDAILAPSEGMPDPRVLRRLAEHVDRHLGGRPEAWLVARRLLQEGFVGTLPELLATAGAVAS